MSTPRTQSHFLTDIIDRDLAAGLHGGRVRTRFPPEPNGYLHIGHAKSICLNFGLAEQYGGTCNLRYDDTNPEKEEQEYVDSIAADVRWLGFAWDGEARFASDYFEAMYRWAEDLVRMGKAYVCSLSVDEVREYRGRFDVPGRESPYRDRSVEENLDLLRRMRAGEFPDGAHTLRAKIDMASPNMLMRDPLLYRIKHATHHRTGDDWCIYPMYDYAHCLEDAVEEITHSICTLEFESNRELYDWVLDTLALEPRPHQYEFARLNLGYTVMSKRKLLQLVQDGTVRGWDDPRMPTLAGMRRRGITPEAIRAFCDMIGVAKNNSVVDIAKLEFCIRDDLNARAPRRMGVLRPLPVTLTNWPEDEVDVLDAPSWPHDVPKEGSRPVPFSKRLLVEREDFALEPPKGWHRLAPGREVRLRYAYVIRCDEVVRDPETGEVVELRCTVDRSTRGGTAPAGRDVKGTLHWVSEAHAIPAEVRLYDRLLTAELPEADPTREFKSFLNPESLVVLPGARLEPALAGAAAGERFQLERQGYFFTDPVDSRPDALVLNRIITLRDSWAKGEAKTAAEGRPERRRTTEDAAVAAAAPVQTFEDQLHQLLARDPALPAFRTAAAAAAPLAAIDRWLVGELQAALRDRSVRDLPFDAAAFGRLVAEVESGSLTTAAARQVLEVLVREGGDPAAIAESRGLRSLSDEGALRRAVEESLAAHPNEAARLRSGESKLLGFFVGDVMRRTSGRADAKRVRELLAEPRA